MKEINVEPIHLFHCALIFRWHFLNISFCYFAVIFFFISSHFSSSRFFALLCATFNQHELKKNKNKKIKKMKQSITDSTSVEFIRYVRLDEMSVCHFYLQLAILLWSQPFQWNLCIASSSFVHSFAFNEIKKKEKKINSIDLKSMENYLYSLCQYYSKWKNPSEDGNGYYGINQLNFPFVCSRYIFFYRRSYKISNIFIFFFFFFS